MPYTVEVPGHGVVEVPDGVSLQQAQIEIEKAFPYTGEDIAGAMQDPTFTPTKSDYLKFEEYSKTKQVDWITTAAQAADAAIGMIGGAVSEGAQGAAVNPLNYIEGFAQGTRQLYGLAAQSQDPSSPLFKFKDLVAGTGTPESRYNQFLDARQFGITSARLERGEEGIVVPPEYTNPEYVQGVSMILDPTLFVPGVGEILGASKLATRAVGKGAQLTGRAVAGAAKPLERFAGAAERMTAEALGMAPEALRSTAATAGIAGALGIAPEAAAFAAIPAGIRTAREAGEALSRAGENLMTQPSRIGPLQAIGAAPGANLRQRMLGVIGQYGGDAAVDASLRGLAGGIEGGVIGTGLGYLSGGEEGAAAGLGSGGVQGVAGALGGRAYQKLTGAAAKEARAGDLGRFIDGQQDPTTKALFERVRDAHGVDTASALMDVGDLVKGKLGDIDIRYLSDVDFADQFGGRARGVQVEIGDRPTIVINADILGKGKGDSPLYTLGHELFHALEKSEQLAGGATEIKNALVGRWIQEGDVIRKLADGVFSDAEIDARFNEYRDKLSAGSPQRADELAKFDTINKKADYIASELAAEHFAALIAGQKPDAMLKGFSGLTRQLLDAALTQNSSKAIARAAASIESTFGVKPTDSVLFPDLKQASPQLNAMLRDLVRARRKLDEKIILDTERGGRVLKPEDISNPLAAKELINLGLAEQMPDGSIRNLSSEEIRVREDRDVTSLRSIVEKVPGARIVDGEVLGRYSPEQLSAIEQSQTISSRMKDMIRGANLAIENGNSLFVTYYAALRRVKNKVTGKESPKYDSGIRVSEREFSPYSFRLTKADNPLVNAIDITLVRNQLTKLLKKDGSVGGLWGNVDGFMSDLAKYFTNLDQKEGARRSAEIFGVNKAKFLGDFVTSNEKSGSKFVRSFRLDRVGSMSPGEFRAKFSEEAYQLSKTRWMPAEKLGDKSITNSEEGYRIISGAKHKLYGTDGKLIGIYDTQTQAERKADATQERLQPEVSQQQRQAGDEGRQATEAGGRNRIERGQEGQGQGGPVRQEGDVSGQRFMPAADREVTRAVNINDSSQDFTGQILKGQKTIETRDTLNNALQGVLGQRIGLARTGTGDTKVVGYATVAKQPIVYRNESEFRRDQGKHLVEPDSKYDIKKGGVKYGYELTDVVSVEPFAPKSVNMKYSVIEPRYMPSDTDYLSAVKQGDTKAAQQMVDEAAKAAGAINNARPLYHGGNKTKTSFASGATRSGMGLAYLTDKKQVAWKYALGGGINDEMSLPDYRRQQLKKLPSREPTVQKLYVIGDVADFSSYSERPNAPQLIEMFGEKRMSRILEEYSSQYRDELDRGESVESTLQNALDEGGFVQEDTNATAAVPELQFIASSGLLSEYLKNIKKDVIAYNDDEAGGKTYVVFDPTQIKSADPITKDDAGNVIPLSQRFKATSEDIRYMPQPDSAMPGAYSFPGGYRAIPGKAKGSLRLYGPAGSLIGIASSLDEAQRILRRKGNR